MAKMELLTPFVLSWEGGFVNDPDDSGGATNKGVTLATYRNVFGRQKTVEDLKKMSTAQWEFIFKKYYWDKWKADEIVDQSVANILVDWIWMSGNYGVRIPQALIGVKVDGVVGPKTIGALNGFKDGQEKLFNALWGDRKSFFELIAKGNKKKFLRGWLNRLNGIKYGRLVCNGGKTIMIR